MSVIVYHGLAKMSICDLEKCEMFKKIGSYFKRFFKKSPFMGVLVSVTAVAIIVSMIFCFDEPKDFITAMPIFVSLIIMLLQSEANRYAFLLGSLNSLLYAVADSMFTLYSSALSALLISFPIQMLTFIRWNKRKYKDSTVFSKLSWKMRGLCVLIGIGAVIALNFALSGTGSDYLLLDNVSNVIGYFTSIFTFMSFIEYPFLQITGLAIGTVNYFFILADGDLAIVPRVIYNLYCGVCIVRATISVYKLYKEQNASKKE